MILPDIELEPVLIPHHKGRKRLHLGMYDRIIYIFNILYLGTINNTNFHSFRIKGESVQDGIRLEAGLHQFFKDCVADPA